MRKAFDSELRLSLRAAAVLFLLPQACMVAALCAVLLETRGGAAPHARPNSAQAETAPTLVALPQGTPPPDALREALVGLMTQFTPEPAGAKAPGTPISIKNLLDRVLAARGAHAETAGPRGEASVARPEAREAAAARLAGELDGALDTLDGFAPPEGLSRPGAGRLEETRALIQDLQGLQTSFAQIRGAGGALGGMGGALEGLGKTLGQLMPLLDAVQQLRSGGLGREDGDSGGRTGLDRFLGRDDERPRRLALLALLAWALETPADA